MSEEIYPSLFICDCGYECDFSPSTGRETKAASMKKKQALIADDARHAVIFDHGDDRHPLPETKDPENEETEVKAGCRIYSGACL